MTKPYTKQALFSKRFSGKNAQSGSSPDALPLIFLDKISVFETLRSFDHRVFCLKEHIRRLRQSCQALGRDLPCPSGVLERWLNSQSAASGMPNATLRLAIHWADKEQGALSLIIRPFEGHPREWYEKGVSLMSSAAKRWTLKAQDPQIKSSQYVSGVLAYLDKGGLPAHELLFLGSGGTVAEGTVSNLFIISGKSLLTPSVGSGILKGVTRSVVLELAARRGWRVLEMPLTRHDLYTASECFLTNTSSEVLPVVEIDRRKIGAGIPGEGTRLLAQDFKKRR